VVELDLSDLNSIKMFVEKFQNEYHHVHHGKLDVLLNNAGVTPAAYQLT